MLQPTILLAAPGMLGPFSTLTAAIKEAIRLILDTAALLLDEFDVKQVAQAQVI